MNNTKIPVGAVELPNNTESSYQMDGRKYIVTSVFREGSTETLGSILMKLIREEAQQKK